MFDAHFHWFPADLVERAREAYPRNTTLRAPFEKTDDTIRVMDANGIQTSLISYGAFREFLIDSYPGGRAEACRVLNERTAELRARFPGRFLMVAAVDELQGEAAVPELERAVTDYGCSALELLNCYPRGDDTFFPNDKLFWPLYKKAEELDIPVFVHPTIPPFWKKLPSVVQFMQNDWGFLLADHFAVNLVASGGVFEAFPKLQFIFCQLGGFIPFSLGRSDLGYAMNQAFQTRKPPSDDLKVVRLRDYCGRFYVDTHSMDYAAIRCAAETLGADRILLATDYPITVPEMGAPWHLAQVDKTELGAEAISAIKYGNAKKLFKL